jgi:hypothetical protein
MIGSLPRLIRGAAIQAVLDGTEKVTRAALDDGTHNMSVGPGHFARYAPSGQVVEPGASRRTSSPK